jgi:hypothetical protein
MINDIQYLHELIIEIRKNHCNLVTKGFSDRPQIE